MYDFKLPQALVEIDRAVGLDGAGNRFGPLLVAVELVIVMGLTRRLGPLSSIRLTRQLGKLQSMGSTRRLEPLRSMRLPKHFWPLRLTRSMRNLGPL